MIMKRKLIAQMLTEWRTNVWLVIELLIVLVVMQFLFGILFQIYELHSAPKGYDVADTYMGYTELIDEDSPEYTPYTGNSSKFSDFEMLLAELRNNPYVESAGVAGSNSTPYSLGYHGNTLCIEDEDTTYMISINRRELSPEQIRIMRMEGANGETPDQLAQILERGEILLGAGERRYMWNPDEIDPNEIVGKNVFIGFGDTVYYHVGGVASTIRRSDYEPVKATVMYHGLTPGKYYENLMIRVKPGMADKFEESIESGRRQFGNVSLYKVVSLETMRERVNLEANQMIRNTTTSAFFLLLVIFLGCVGTFWFRTQQRAGEIAIRKVSGATDSDIFRRFIGEGLVLLVIAAVLSVPFTAYLLRSELHSQLLDIEVSPSIYIAGAVGATVVMALLIIAGIWAPARKAVKVDPAYALSDQ